MKIFSLVFCVLSFSSSAIFSQTDIAVTTKGDTLRGKVKILTYDIVDRVQVTIDKKKKTYTALEVKSIITEGQTYHTVKHEKGYRYMKLIKPGFLSLYGFRMPNQSAYDGQYLSRRDGAGMEIPNLTFKKSMASFLDGCAEVQERIKSGDLGRKDIDQIIDRYNSCLQFKTEKKVEIVPPPTPIENEKMVAINSLISKVETTADFANKTDVLDLLKDLRAKVGRNEILPNYLTKDIKNYFGAQPQFTEELEALLLLLKK
jgi:hypothetical protein